MARFVSEGKGAEHIGIDLSRFRELVRLGHLPGPHPLVGLYDVAALNAACDRLSGLAGPRNALDAWIVRKGRDNDPRHS